EQPPLLVRRAGTPLSTVQLRHPLAPLPRPLSLWERSQGEGVGAGWRSVGAGVADARPCRYATLHHRWSENAFSSAVVPRGAWTTRVESSPSPYVKPTDSLAG